MKKKYNSTLASLICLYYGIAICDFVMLLYALMNETTGSLSIFFYSFLNCWYYKTSNMVHRSLVFMLSVNDCYRRLVLHNLITGRGVSRFFSILNDDNLWQPSSRMLSTAFVLYLCYYHKFQMECLTLLLILHRYQFLLICLYFFGWSLCKWISMSFVFAKIDKENIDIVSYCRHTVEEWPRWVF